MEKGEDGTTEEHQAFSTDLSSTDPLHLKILTVPV
jgi:hypothetical protein